MARIDYVEALKAAERYADSLQRQKIETTMEVEAEMLDRRRDFLQLADRVFFESIVEGSDLLPMRYFAVGQLAAQAVGRIHLSMADRQAEGFATGFLVAPNLLLTNKHVLRTKEWARSATLTMDAEDSVDGLPKMPRLFQFDPGRLYVSDDKLDFCVVAVAPQAIDGTPLKQFGYLRLFSTTGKIVRDEYATIIQHPNGRQKHIASRNNKITVYVYDNADAPQPPPENNFLYYSTDTLKGSSGSPVFSDQWYVVALHRRGVPLTKRRGGQTVIMRTNGKPAALDDPDEVIAYTSNEGVRISRILARLKEIGDTADNPESMSAREAVMAINDAAGHPGDGPVSDRTSRFAVLNPNDQKPERDTASTLEIVKRKLSVFPDDLGYQANFLEGFSIPLPQPKPVLVPELAPRIDKPGERLLPFRHFTTVMHARRKLPVFAAVNISGADKPEGSMGPRPSWSFDPRIDLQHQPDDSIFSIMLQRGHLAARDYVYWGMDADEVSQADIHSFTLTNVCPQIARFNGNKEWYEIERSVAEGAETETLRITEFVGPIFGAADPDYDDLRGAGSTAEFGTGIRIPLRFWKIVAWVENGVLKHRALILDQSGELDEAGPLEFDIETPNGVVDSTIEEISEMTNLQFDGFGN
jgi:endonuclease G